MIDNSKLIERLFYFNENNNMFFHCQIVRRAKDYPNGNVKEGVIHSYFIKSAEHLTKLMPEIKLLCDYYGARAYINVSGKDFSKVNTLMLVEIANYIYQGNSVNPRKILNSAAGKTKSRSPKWIIDIDDKDIDNMITIKNAILHLLKEKYGKSTGIVGIVETLNGWHIITEKFNSKKFSEIYPDVSIHKNSMGTLLYMPDLNK